MMVFFEDDEEIERHDAHIRTNPSGHKELVVKRKGKPDDETLNELARHLNELLEGMEIANGGAILQPNTPLMVGSSGDLLRNQGESPNTMTSSLPQAADGPELSRAKSSYLANARDGELEDKYIAGSEDSLRSGPYSESFTGTSCIAMPPAPFGMVRKRKKRSKLADLPTESVMSRAVIKEWEPPFKAAGYTPGEYQMPSPTGDGVAARKPTQDSVGAYDTDTSASGKEWPRDHKDTAAMCDVDEDGVEHKPQGGHESTHGEPNDGHQKKLGHDWPAEAHNDGSGVAEPFEGDRWSDGGTLKGQAPGELENSGESASLPSDGPITGTSGPQNGQMESWNPERFASLMEGDFDIQGLFDNYARSSNYVCLEDFRQLCEAHGVQIVLDETSLLRLMDNNKELMFVEGSDASGSYWMGQEIQAEEWEKPWLKKDKKDKADGNSDEDDGADDECVDECDSVKESATRNRRTINEFGGRLPGLHGMPGAAGGGGPLPGGIPGGMGGVGGGVEDDLSDLTGGGMGGMGGMQDDLGPGPMDIGGGYQSCPECGYEGAGTDEESCPECGVPMGGSPMDELGGENPDFGGELDSDLHGSHGKFGGESHVPSFRESREIVVGPKMVASLQKFMESATSIVEKRSEFRREAIGEALQLVWQFHASNVDPRQAPSSIRESLQRLMKQYKGFNPLREDHKMDRQGGSPIGGGGKPGSSSFLSQEDNPGPDQIEEQGEPLGKAQKNNLEGTPVMKGTEKGMTGNGNTAQSVKENVNRLANHIRKPLLEAARGLNGQRYGTSYTILVKEGKKLNRTSRRGQLAEALADLEEILQLHEPRMVALEATISQGANVIRRHTIPMVGVKSRGPMLSEGAAIFRFQRTAESFANELVAAGATCRIMPHKWGHAVAAKVNYQAATRAFKGLNESKK